MDHELLTLLRSSYFVIRNSMHPYAIFHLGDSALSIEFGNAIDDEIHNKVLRLYHSLHDQKHPYILDLVPAYCSLAIYYDIIAVRKDHPHQTAFETMSALVEQLTLHTYDIGKQGREIEVPVCYSEKFAPDMKWLCTQKNISEEEFVHLHSSGVYRVYMLGFLPGFVYMGKVDERIAIERKDRPKQLVASGSVGIAGMQTGIYPMDSPGGWQIIGRTPLQLFRRDDEHPVLFSPGDRVKFYSISENEFKDHQDRNS